MAKIAHLPTAESPLPARRVIEDRLNAGLCKLARIAGVLELVRASLTELEGTGAEGPDIVPSTGAIEMSITAIRAVQEELDLVNLLAARSGPADEPDTAA